MKYGLHDSMGYWINRLAMTMHEVFDHVIAPLGVTAPQWAVLIALHQGDAETPTELARFIGIDASAITRLVDHLEAKGLLVRRSHGSDRRSLIVVLTEAGRELAPKLGAISQRENEKFLGGLTEAEVAEFKRLILKVLRDAGSGQKSGA